MGTSMGGMHTWVWGQRYPDSMDALMPLASLPDQISGRNRAWRRVAIDAIRTDPSWVDGNYTTQPRGLRTVAQMLWLASSNPVIRQKEAPTLADADRVLDAYVANYLKTGDANDIVYAIEASRDYDPAPGSGRPLRHSWRSTPRTTSSTRRSSASSSAVSPVCAMARPSSSH